MSSSEPQTQLPVLPGLAPTLLRGCSTALVLVIQGATHRLHGLLVAMKKES